VQLVPIGKIAEGDHAEQQVYLAVTLPQQATPSSTAAPTVHLLPDTPAAR
jgi:hypothetical protein